MSSNKYKVLVVQGLHEQGLEMLKQRSDIEFNVLLSDDENEILEAAKDVNGITVRTAQITEKIINCSKNLQVISRHGVGYDSINLKSLNNKKIPLTIAAHSNMISVSEQAMFFLLALNKNVFYYDDFTRKGDWTNRWDVKAWDLAGKNIMVIGFGRIGSNFVKRALAFDMNVYVYDPYIDHEKIKKSGAIPIQNFKDNLSKMDAITLHCPKNEETTNLFTKKEFQTMKKTAFIINCARGSIINEDDLLTALNEGIIASAALDVFVGEPNPRIDIISNDKIALTPHIGAATTEAQDRIGIELADQIIKFLKDV